MAVSCGRAHFFPVDGLRPTTEQLQLRCSEDADHLLLSRQVDKQTSSQPVSQSASQPVSHLRESVPREQKRQQQMRKRKKEGKVFATDRT